MAKKYIPIFTGIKNKKDEKVVRKMFKKIVSERVRKESVGDPFISVHRNPCGLISIIHHVGYDV